MVELIPPVDRDLLKKELTPDKFVRPTNKSNNEIYILTAHNSPNVMREIGRLRELAFRSWGGGTGEEIDVDKFDFLEKPFKQLIVWDKECEEIVGGCRYLSGRDVEIDSEGQPAFVMSHLFKFSDLFMKDYLPYSVELGRAFIQPIYQTSQMGTKSLFALDNLWDGLGALIYDGRNTCKYLVGKVTIYDTYPTVARELIYEYMSRYFPDEKKLVSPIKSVNVSEEGKKKAAELMTTDDILEDYKILQKEIRRIGTTIPPLFNAYIGLTETMRVFGSMIDYDFHHAYETGIMVLTQDISDAKRKRYIDPYIEYVKNKK